MTVALESDALLASKHRGYDGGGVAGLDDEKHKASEPESIDLSHMTEEGLADSGWSWIVCMAAFLVHVVVLGTIYSFGVLIMPLVHEFHVGRGSISWIIAINNTLFLGCGWGTGYAADRLGHRWVVLFGSAVGGSALILCSFATAVWQLYVLFGLVLGAAFSCAFMPAISVTTQWFSEKRRGLAMGIAVAGSGVGTLVIPPLLDLYIESYGWRAAFRLEAYAVYGILAPLAFLFKSRLTISAGHTISFPSFLFTDRFFVTFFVVNFVVSIGYVVPFVHLVPYAEDLGIESAQAALIISAMGLASTVGRVALGYCADVYGRLLMLRISMSICAVATFAWLLCVHFWSIVLYAAIYGLFSGSVIALVSPLLAENFHDHRDKLASIIGMSFFGPALANLIGAPVVGVWFDRTSSYTYGILYAASALAIGAIVSFFLRARLGPDVVSKSQVVESSSV